MAINHDSHQWFGVLDVKTDGPHGAVFALSVVIYRAPLDIVDEFFARLPDAALRHAPTRDALLPALVGERPTDTTYRVMLERFARWYLEYATHTSWVGTSDSYLGHATLFRDLQKNGLIKETGHPAHIVDVFSLLLGAGDAAPTLEEYFMRRMLPLQLQNAHLEPLHPIRACVVAGAVFFDLLKRRGAPDEPRHDAMPSSTAAAAAAANDTEKRERPITPTPLAVQPAAAPNEPTEGFADAPLSAMPPPPPVAAKPHNGHSTEASERAQILADAGFGEDDDPDDKKCERCAQRVDLTRSRSDSAGQGRAGTGTEARATNEQMNLTPCRANSSLGDSDGHRFLRQTHAARALHDGGLALLRAATLEGDDVLQEFDARQLAQRARARLEVVEDPAHHVRRQLLWCERDSKRQQPSVDEETRCRRVELVESETIGVERELAHVIESTQTRRPVVSDAALGERVDYDPRATNRNVFFDGDRQYVVRHRIVQSVAQQTIDHHAYRFGAYSGMHEKRPQICRPACWTVMQGTTGQRVCAHERFDE